VESLYSMIDITGDKMSLSDYYEHFIARRKASKAIGLSFASTNLQAAASPIANHCTYKIGTSVSIAVNSANNL